MLATIVATILLQPQTKLAQDDAPALLRLVVDIKPPTPQEYQTFRDLSASEFDAKADGKIWHRVGGGGWIALVSEAYLPLRKMQELTRLQEKFAREPDLIIDKNSDQEVLSQVRALVSEAGGLRVDKLTRSPEFNALVSSRLTVTLEMNGKRVTVPMSGPSESRQEETPVAEVEDEEADKRYRRLGPDTPPESPLYYASYSGFPMCVQFVEAGFEPRPETLISELVREVGKLREEQRVKMRETYFNFLSWVNQESTRVLAGTRINGTTNEWPQSTREELVRRIKHDYTALGFRSEAEAESWAESGPTLVGTRIRPFVRVSGHDPKSGQNWGFTLGLEQPWLRPPPEANRSY